VPRIIRPRALALVTIIINCAKALCNIVRPRHHFVNININITRTKAWCNALSGRGYSFVTVSNRAEALCLASSGRGHLTLLLLLLIAPRRYVIYCPAEDIPLSLLVILVIAPRLGAMYCPAEDIPLSLLVITPRLGVVYYLPRIFLCHC
jgi:hypothetical protein